jgi:hypothetical protein
MGLIIAAAVIYPRIKPHREEKDPHPEHQSRRMLVLGIALAILAAFWDGSESLVSSHLIGDEVVDSME